MSRAAQGTLAVLAPTGRPPCHVVEVFSAGGGVFVLTYRGEPVGLRSRAPAQTAAKLCTSLRTSWPTEGWARITAQRLNERLGSTQFGYARLVAAQRAQRGPPPQ